MHTLSFLLHPTWWLVAGLLLLGVGIPSQSQAQDDIEARIDALMARMTLDEKIGQMNQYSNSWDLTGPVPTGRSDSMKYELIRSGGVGSMLNILSAEQTRAAQRMAVENSRLGIPLIFGYDVIHGYRTMFPIPLGEAASWDLAAIETSARIAATEAASAGIHWTFAPMVDIARDARWGRVMESAGEDPYLGARVATARVRGFQGTDLAATNTIAACAKHFAAYGYAEAGKDYNTVNIGEALLQDVVLPPFRAAAEAGVATFMNAFNEIDGIPATANIHLQREILKGAWNWDGFVVSDWASIAELVPHGMAADLRDAARLAIAAGSDMDMEGYSYQPHLAELVAAGVVDEALIDDAVRRILRVKFRLGLFEDPYRYCDSERERRTLLAPAHLEASREVARKSIVLLKNEGQVLPLKRSGTIAVIGPLAADKDVPLGSWRGNALSNSAVSLLEGIQAAVGSRARVRYAQGCRLTDGSRSFVTELRINESDTTGFGEAVRIARGADVVVMALGEDCFQSGEARSRVSLDLPGVQAELLAAVRAVNPNIVLVLMNGRPLVLTDIEPQVSALVEGWFLGSQSGHALADVLFGSYNPSGKLPVSFPRSVGQVPIYYSHKSTGRPSRDDGLVFWTHYTDEQNTPLYPFGYGLSYTRFAIENLRLSAPVIGMDDVLTATVTVRNTGSVGGTEVVQLYVRDLVGSRTRPVMELKGFEQVSLKPGESREVQIALRASDLAFYTMGGTIAAEPGDFEVMVGPNSRDQLRATFTLK
ncbi:MAG: beta-glucosidase BglX [Bacteroidia bacterium]